MAKDPRRRQSTESIKSEITASRTQVAREIRSIRHELDIGRKIRRSLREHTGLWVGAAVALGVVVMLAPRKKEVHVDLATGKKSKPEKKFLEAGFILGVLRLAAPLLKPMVTKFITQRVQQRHRSMSGLF